MELFLTIIIISVVCGKFCNALDTSSLLNSNATGLLSASGLGNAIKTTGVLGAVNTKTISQAAKDPCSLAQTTGNIASTSQLGNSAQAFLSGNFQQGSASALQALNAKSQAAAKEKQCRDLMSLLTGSGSSGSSTINNSGANLLSSGGGALSGLSSLSSSGTGLSGISKLFNGVNLSKLLTGALNTPNPLLPPV
uniref:Uncharacterized protein n=1 Tax=Romanomermis culicivorax TaxID=13658 RepID=A0A915J8C0_ROMCU